MRAIDMFDERPTALSKQTPMAWVVLALCGVLWWSCLDSPEGDDCLRIGLLVQEMPFISQPVIQAVRMAIDDANAQGGLEAQDGQRLPIELFVRSEFETPEQAVVAIRELIYREKVSAIIGPVLSRHAIPAAAVAEQVGVPMISPGSTHPETTAGKRWVFRMVVLDEFQGRVIARFALEDLEASTAAILYEVSDPSGRSIGEGFRDAFVAAGGEVVASETYTFGDDDFSERLATIHRRDPEVLFLPNPIEQAVVQVRLARGLGLDATVLGSDIWAVAKMSRYPELEGAFAFQHWHTSFGTASGEAELFSKAFQERHGTAPSDMAAMAWDAAGLILAAAQAGSSSETIRQGLARMEGYRGASGEMTFAGRGGNPPKAAIILGIRNGQVELAEYFPASDVPEP